jgi:hypothetical protein
LSGPPKRTLLSDSRIAEPINGDSGNLDVFFKNLQAMKRQFSLLSDELSVDQTEPGGKRQKLDSVLSGESEEAEASFGKVSGLYYQEKRQYLI